MKPLSGLRVLVTRPREQAAELAALLENAGAEPVVMPTIAIAPPDDWSEADRAIARLPHYDWILVTSVNAARALGDRLCALGISPEGLDSPRIAAVGPRTAEALTDLGFTVVFHPARHLAQELVEDLEARTGLVGAQILLPRGDLASPELPKRLHERGASVTDVVIYRTVYQEHGSIEAMLRDRRLDWITLTSGSAVRSLYEQVGDPTLFQGVPIASIGPVTTQAAKELGLDVTVEAEPHTIQGLVQALIVATSRAPEAR